MDENTKIALERQNPWWFEKPFDTGIDRLQWHSKVTKHLKVSSETVKEYISYADYSYLLYKLTKYDRSIKNQTMSQKKIYCIDTGLRKEY